MTEELINMDGIGNALVYIADKIGVSVAQMYEIYVKAQATMALLQIALILIVIGVSIGIFLLFYFYAAKKMDDTLNDTDRFLLSGMISIVSLVIMAFICSALYYPLLAYFCPEYTALQSLMQDIGNIAKVLR